MQETLTKYLPKNSVGSVENLIKKHQVYLKIVPERKTRHGDYRRLPNGGHQITVNANLNPYRFLITLIHEIAHLKAYEDYGRYIRPHGKEWKHSFRQLFLSFLNPDIFPSDLLPLLAIHFKNPRASSDTDTKLSLALRAFDPKNGKKYIFEIPTGTLFKIHNGRVFKKGKKRVKRYECIEISTKKNYVFQPNAEVELINDLGLTI